LSGGQRQRVAMGRAIVREPAVFLFDEPLSNLDAKLRGQMRIEIRQLQQRLGTTGIYVTHDQVEAMTLGDRLMIMNGGRVEQIGSPLEIYERPASVFVGGFIGAPAMNFLDATVSEGGRALQIGVERVALPQALPAPGGRPLTLGLRPEHLALARDGAPGTLQIDAVLIEALGADTVVHGRIAGDGAELTIRLAGTIKVAAGDRLSVTADPERLHLFDSATGQRLGI
jgi:sn-glycerol 3-phosphate transport system ATP-binding protein